LLLLLKLSMVVHLLLPALGFRAQEDSAVSSSERTLAVGFDVLSSRFGDSAGDWVV
jgi:hypothetical protein